MSNVLVIDNFEPIPPIFFPDGKEMPFCNCSICGKQLLKRGQTYMIEKAYKQDIETQERELIFEIVYCFECIEKLREELSEESKQKLEVFYKENIDFEKRHKQLSEHELFETDIWLNNCVVSNKAIDEVNEFQIYALCDGGDILYHQTPYMICGEVIDQVTELISNKTLDFLNDFLLDHIDLPPEFADIINTPRPVFI